tara:strand:+ start:2826 stop:2930 length:105 start_codon:yes stop_codon:yes gene_type:complete
MKPNSKMLVIVLGGARNLAHINEAFDIAKVDAVA